MTNVRLKYLHSFTDRHGHVRFYFRYRGKRSPLPAPHDEGFATAYDELLAEIKANPIPLKNNVAFLRGSLGWVIEQFLLRRHTGAGRKPPSETIAAYLTN
jgi:hypothetical protein